jgi:hypothetical protein
MSTNYEKKCGKVSKNCNLFTQFNGQFLYTTFISTYLMRSQQIRTLATIINTSLLNAEIVFTKIANECVGWIHPDEDTIQFRTFVNTVINLPVSIKARTFWGNWIFQGSLWSKKQVIFKCYEPLTQNKIKRGGFVAPPPPTDLFIRSCC